MRPVAEAVIVVELVVPVEPKGTTYVVPPPDESS
jgi:hypothetical protein